MQTFRHHVSSRSYAFGLTHCGLAATIAWGTFDEAEARSVIEAWTAQLDGPQYASLLDISHLVFSDDGSFGVFREHLERFRNVRARSVGRQALVARPNFAATLVHGYFAMFPAPHEQRTFADRDAALRWLQHPCCRAGIERMDEARLDLLNRLRQLLDVVPLGDVTVHSAAATLGVTSRTLQRRLAEAPTRFATEYARAQVTRAQRLMRETDRKLSDLALEVGCATPSAFSEVFRRVTGISPSEWRRGRIDDRIEGDVERFGERDRRPEGRVVHEERHGPPARARQ
jgi:AraC-like DNA-binding protein